jgi:dsRNA-specific ribonuclease
VVEAVGPPHRRTFHVEVSWDSGSVRAEGRSKKTAEAAAAKEALAFMKTDMKTVEKED